MQKELGHFKIEYNSEGILPLDNTNSNLNYEKGEGVAYNWKPHTAVSVISLSTKRKKVCKILASILIISKLQHK